MGKTINSSADIERPVLWTELSNLQLRRVLAQDFFPAHADRLARARPPPARPYSPLGTQRTPTRRRRLPEFPPKLQRKVSNGRRRRGLVEQLRRDVARALAISEAESGAESGEYGRAGGGRARASRSA